MTTQITLPPPEDDSDSGRWAPEVGAEAHQLLNRQLGISRERVTGEAVSVLEACLPPGEHGHRTALAVGEVQSGKTLSFELVMALARDNGFALIVLIAGTSQLLLDQSRRRLGRDLGLEDDDAWRRWKHFPSPNQNRDLHQFRQGLDAWARSQPPQRKTLLVSVMKNHAQLRDLADLLEAGGPADIPALVVDDEADRASLNVRVQAGGESSTYREILRVRRALGSHSFLQYTATPQAPLLISIADTLSPDVVRLLSRGDGYVSAGDFFPQAGRSPFVKVIPAADAQAVAQPSLQTPPDSLYEALRVFLVGVAAGLHAGGEGHRSMLIHPSRRTLQHTFVDAWVTSAVDHWRRALIADPDDPDRQETLELFQLAFDDLAQTERGLPTFEAVAALLPRAIEESRIEVVNAAAARRGAAEIRWNQAYSWILIGGQMLDRGFTVEGLTVTYMPRDVGVGAADTLQQRSRWLGYKREYLGFCRIYVERATLDAFAAYVEHETSMRRELERMIGEGIPLGEWRRRFLLDPQLRPTRSSVIGRGLIRGDLARRWVEQRDPVYTPELISENARVLAEFKALLGPLTADGSHEYGETTLRDVTEQLLNQYKTLGEDQATFIALLLQISAFLDEHENEPARIYWMDGGRERIRHVSPHGDGYRIDELFQGRSPAGAARYPGDRHFVLREAGTTRLTVQAHVISPRGAPDSGVVAGATSPCPVLAVWVPDRFSAGVVVEV